MKIIVDGEFDISDETGQKVHAVKGDVFYCKFKATKYLIWVLIQIQSPKEARLLSLRRHLAWGSLLVNARYIYPSSHLPLRFKLQRTDE